MTVTTKLISIAQVLRRMFAKEANIQVQEHSDYKKAVYPLFGLMSKSKEINKHKRDQEIEPIYEMKAFASEFFSGEDAALKLAIKSAEALSALRRGYSIKSLPGGDFIATRENVSAYVRALPYVESLFHRSADTISVDDINELAELKAQHNCSAAIYLSFSHSNLEQKFYCKAKDVFGLDGLTLFTLLTEGTYAKANDYIKQHKIAA